jgi:uncharacterized membrane protein (UPF0127 family)
MPSPMPRSLVPALLVALLVAAQPGATRAADAATKACANPELPRAILDGDPAAPGKTELRTIRIEAPSAGLRLAVADTEKRRELGLMCVTALRADAGMIFVFSSGGDVEFWMKNTLVPLDMVWVEADGRVTTVAANVPASSLEESDDKVARRTGHGRYVIELRAGDAARAGIVKGGRLTVPALAPAP